MSLLGRSFLDIQDLDAQAVSSLFDLANKIRCLHDSRQLKASFANRFVTLVFFEASTRTRAGFEAAAYRLGLSVSCPEMGQGSSRSKGETLMDSFDNLAAMGPEIMVVRYGESEEFTEHLKKSSIPVINAGSGKTAHPTQALLDAFTMRQHFGELKGLKILIVGDIEHGRVAKSNIKLLEMMGASIAICGPSEFIPKDLSSSIKVFSSVDEGIEWANVVMALRIQLERHASGISLTLQEYRQKFGITGERMMKLGDAVFMHPGPINRGVEVDSEALKDSRSLVLTQVENAVYVRAALMSQILGIEVG